MLDADGRELRLTPWRRPVFPAVLARRTSLPTTGTRPGRNHTMMAPNKNAIVLFSVRAAAGAAVSMPVRWEELSDGVQPRDVTIRTSLAGMDAAARFFSPVLQGGQELGSALRSVGLPDQPAREVAHRVVPEWRSLGERLRVDCVLGGWAPAEGEASPHLGLVLVGLYHLGELAFEGKVPVPREGRHRLHVVLAERAAEASPFVTPVHGARAPHWVHPELVCRVECSGRTAGPDLRAPAYAGLPENRRPRDCDLHQCAGAPQG